MRALALNARRGRIDYEKIAAVLGLLIGSWAVAYGIGRVVFALVG
jgi:hypothetical protein